MATTYTIKIYGGGYEIGLGSLSADQYNYWCENDTELVPHILKESDAPRYAELGDPIERYSDVRHLVGVPAGDDTWIEVGDGESLIFGGSYLQYLEEYGAGDADGKGLTRSLDEIVLTYDFGGERKRCIFWEKQGRGVFYECQVVADNFSGDRLGFDITDVDGRHRLITGVHYGGSKLEGMPDTKFLQLSEAMVLRY